MKKITFAMLSKLMMLTLMVCSAFSASADVDLGAMTLNTVYDCPTFKNVRGSFTPETDGVYRINYSASDQFAIYTDAELTAPYENGGDWAYNSETIEGMKLMGYQTWNFVGGTTYYLGGSVGEGLFIMNSNANTYFFLIMLNAPFPYGKRYHKSFPLPFHHGSPEPPPQSLHNTFEPHPL